MKAFAWVMGGPIGTQLHKRANLFVERGIPLAHNLRKPGEAEMATWRGPYPTPESREPTHVFADRLTAYRPFLAQTLYDVHASGLTDRPTLLLWAPEDGLFGNPVLTWHQSIFSDHSTVQLHGANHYWQTTPQRRHAGPSGHGSLAARGTGPLSETAWQTRQPSMAATPPAVLPTTVDSDRRRLVYATTLVISVLWIVLDQATKVAAVRLYENAAPDDLGPLILRVIRNDGGAFSLPIQLPWLFVVVAVVVTFLVVRALPDTRSLGLAAAYGLVVGGAIGNGADRIFRDGAVVDMIDLDFPPLTGFPVFNVADIGITVGALLVAILMTREDRRLAKLAQPAVLEPLATPDDGVVTAAEQTVGKPDAGDVLVPDVGPDRPEAETGDGTA